MAKETFVRTSFIKNLERVETSQFGTSYAGNTTKPNETYGKIVTGFGNRLGDDQENNQLYAQNQDTLPQREAKASSYVVGSYSRTMENDSWSAFIAAHDVPLI